MKTFSKIHGSQQKPNFFAYLKLVVLPYNKLHEQQIKSWNFCTENRGSGKAIFKWLNLIIGEYILTEIKINTTQIKFAERKKLNRNKSLVPRHGTLLTLARIFEDTSKTETEDFTKNSREERDVSVGKMLRSQF